LKNACVERRGQRNHKVLGTEKKLPEKARTPRKNGKKGVRKKEGNAQNVKIHEKLRDLEKWSWGNKKNGLNRQVVRTPKP